MVTYKRIRCPMRIWIHRSGNRHPPRLIPPAANVLNRCQEARPNDACLTHRLPVGLVLASADRHESNSIPRLEEERFFARGVERPYRRAADELPPAWHIQRIHAGLRTRNADRATWNTCAWRGVAWRSDALVHDAHIRKPREKAEHENTVGRGRMQRHDLIR